MEVQPKRKTGFRLMFPIIETEEVNIKMIKSVRIFISACFMAVMLPAASYGAAAFPGSYGATGSPSSMINTAEDGKKDSIMMVEEEPVPDDSGNVTAAMSVADDVVLPVTMILKGREGRLSLTVTYNGQGVNIKPGTYRLTRVTDGNGKKLNAGAALTIPEMGGQVYLDFHKPDHGGGSAVKQFILSNLLFIPIALFLYACYRWYETCFLH